MDIFFSRLPVFDLNRNTVGYDLMYSSVNPEIRGTEGEFAEAEGLFKQSYPLLFKEKQSLICFTKELMMKNVPWRLPNTNLLVELTAQMLADKELLEKSFQLKRNGYQIVLRDVVYDTSYNELFTFANYAKIDINTEKDQLTKTIEYCSQLGKPVFVYNVDTQEQFEQASQCGATYIEGNFYTYPVAQSKQSGGPMIKTFLQILAMVYAPEPDIGQIATLISTDPVLTIRLLRQINTVFEGKYNRISSILQALVMLGLDKIKQWVYLVGLQRLNRDAPSELLKTALMRASFCERICKITPGAGDKSQELYLMGLISVITGVSNSNVEKTLDGLPVSEEIRLGLLGEENLYGDIFKLATVYEQGKWEAVDEMTQKLSITPEALADQYLVSVKFANGFTKLG